MRFDDRQAVTISMEMERRGGDFYRRAARVSRSADVVALLGALAREEDEHLAEFSRMAARLSGGGGGAYSLEQSAYLTAIAADIVFPAGVVGLAAGGGLEDAAAVLHTAIQSEKDSILFYSELASCAADDGARAVFAEILGAERGHLARLLTLLEALGREDPL